MKNNPQLKIQLTFLCLMLLVVSNIKSVRAQESTPSASEQSTQNLKTRIEKVVQEKREQIKGVIEKIYQKKRGYIAQVQRVSTGSITIKNAKGIEILPIDEQNVTILKNNKEISLDEIAVENWVIIMGLQEQDSFTLKRILVSDENLWPKDFHVAIGTVEKIDSRKIQIFLRNNQERAEFLIDKNTKYQDLNGNDITLKVIKPETQVLIIGYKDASTTTATTIKSLAVSATDDEK